MEQCSWKSFHAPATTGQLQTLPEQKSLCMALCLYLTLRALQSVFEEDRIRFIDDFVLVNS